jgi:hypothetical protein
MKVLPFVPRLRSRCTHRCEYYASQAGLEVPIKTGGAHTTLLHEQQQHDGIHAPLRTRRGCSRAALLGLRQVTHTGKTPALQQHRGKL